MNGLRVVRTQCNMTIMDVAEKLGVSKQMVSAWEKGVKDISEDRKKQLADLFGLDQSFFGELSDEQMEELSRKPKVMIEGEGERYTYMDFDDYLDKFEEMGGHMIAYVERIQDMSLSDRYKKAKSDRDKVIKSISNYISGAPDLSLRDQTSRIKTYNRLFDWFLNVLEAVEESPDDVQAYMNLAVTEMLGGMQKALGREPVIDEAISRGGYYVSDECMNDVADFYNGMVEKEKQKERDYSDYLRKITEEFYAENNIDPLTATDEDWKRFDEYLKEKGVE